MVENTSCNKENFSYPVVNKTHKLCQVHNWERTHKGQIFLNTNKTKRTSMLNGWKIEQLKSQKNAS